MSQYQSQPTDFSCNHCGRAFSSIRGLRIHVTKLHEPLFSNPASTVRSQLEPSVPLLLPFHEELSYLRTNSRIILRVPHSVRVPVALELGIKLISEYVSTNSSDCWRRLLIFPHVVLNSSGSMESKKTSLSSKIRQNLQQWIFHTVHSTQRLPHRKPNANVHNFDSDSKRARLIEAKVADGDVRGAIPLLSSDEDLSTFTSDVLASLKTKHPPAPSELTPHATGCPIFVNN